MVKKVVAKNIKSAPGMLLLVSRETFGYAAATILFVLISSLFFYESFIWWMCIGVLLGIIGVVLLVLLQAVTPNRFGAFIWHCACFALLALFLTMDDFTPYLDQIFQMASALIITLSSGIVVANSMGVLPLPDIVSTKK